MAMAPDRQHDHPHGHRPEPNSSQANTSSIIGFGFNCNWSLSPPSDVARHVVLCFVAALLVALVVVVALETYRLARHGRRARRGLAGSPPPALLVYSSVSTKLAGDAAECAICLTEFADGDAIRVLPACRHGFHALCIQRWLAFAGRRRSSCPTCRAPVAVATRAAAAAAAQPPA